MCLRISFLSLLFLLFTSLCFALSVSDNPDYPYRIYIGEDRNTDWIDIVSVGHFENTGKIEDGAYEQMYVIDFEDKSSIKKVYLDENILGEKFYWIVKEKSIWKFFDEGINSRLQLVEPIVLKNKNSILIYENKK